MKLSIFLNLINININIRNERKKRRKNSGGLHLSHLLFVLDNKSQYHIKAETYFYAPKGTLGGI